MNPQRDPIVLFGAPRSGTTYLQRILNEHPQVYVSHETRIFAWLHHATNVLTQQDPYLVTHREEFIDHLRRVLPDEIRAFYRSMAPWASYWGDKNPHYADAAHRGCLDTIASLFPNSLFVHIVRDGRDVVASLVRRRHEDGTPWVTFEEAHSTWSTHLENASSFGAATAAERFFELRYEDLVRDDVEVARGMFEFLGIDFDPRVADFCRTQAARRTPLSTPTRDLARGASHSQWNSIFDGPQRLRSLDLLAHGLVRFAYEDEESLGRLRNRISAEAAAAERTSASATA